MWFDAPVRDRHTGLDVPQAECVVLDGEQARKFVRSRYLEYQDEDGDWHTDPTADLGRITRQQVFVRRAVAKAVSEGLTQPDHAQRARVGRRRQRQPRRAPRRRRPARHRRGVRRLRLRRPRGLQHPERGDDDVGRRRGRAPADAQGADDAQRLPGPPAGHARPGEHRRDRAQRHRGHGSGRRRRRRARRRSASTSSTSPRTPASTSSGPRCSTATTPAGSRGGWPPTSPAEPRSCRTTPSASRRSSS